MTVLDDSTIHITSFGIANLNPFLSLDSVLCVPRFPFSLIMTISKLTKSLNCSITYCVFQDLKTRKKLDGGHE